MIIQDFVTMGVKYVQFYRNCGEMPDFEEKSYNFLFSEIMNDFDEKGIKNTGDWLKYYSTDGNDFDEIARLAELYYERVLKAEYDLIDFGERMVAFHGIVLYAKEMDVEIPSNNIRLKGKIIANLIEIIRLYVLYLKGYLSVRGEILVSDTSKMTFYNVWKGSGIEKEMPITL